MCVCVCVCVPAVDDYTLVPRGALPLLHLPNEVDEARAVLGNVPRVLRPFHELELLDLMGRAILHVPQQQHGNCPTNYCCYNYRGRLIIKIRIYIMLGEGGGKKKKKKKKRTIKKKGP